jgi:hypothetical protein
LQIDKNETRFQFTLLPGTEKICASRVAGEARVKDDNRSKRGKGKRNPDDDEEDRPRRKGKKKPAGKSGLVLVPGLLVGGGAVLVVFAAVAGGLVWWLSARPQNPIAKGPATAVNQPAVPDADVKGP